MTAIIKDKKVITSNFTVIQGETGCDELVFKLNKNYNGTDLSTFTAYAGIKRPDGTTDKIQLQCEVSQTESNTLILTLEVNESVTAISGELECQLSFENQAGTVIWKTESFFFQVKNAINAFKDFSERAPDAVTKLQQKMYAYVAQMAELKEEAETYLEEISKANLSPYGQNNKLNAQYVDGLSNVATSGSYTDLLNKPDLSSYVTNHSLAIQLGNFKTENGPILIKWISVSDSDTIKASKKQYNKTEMAKYLASGILKRSLFLWEEENDMYYPVTYYYYDGDEIDCGFDMLGTSYSISYVASTNTFNFGT